MQQQQASPQGSAPCQSSAHGEALSLAAAIEQRWGEEGTESVLRALALHLTYCIDPQLGQYSIKGSSAGLFLTKTIGNKWRRFPGVEKKNSIRQLVASSLAAGCFVITEHSPEEFVIRLNTQTLLEDSRSSSSCGSRPPLGHHGGAATTLLPPPAAATCVVTSSAAAGQHQRAASQCHQLQLLEHQTPRQMCY